MLENHGETLLGQPSSWSAGARKFWYQGQHSWKIRNARNGDTRCMIGYDWDDTAEAMAPSSVDQRSGTLLWEAAIDLGRFISRHLCSANHISFQEFG